MRYGISHAHDNYSREMKRKKQANQRHSPPTAEFTQGRFQVLPVACLAVLGRLGLCSALLYTGKSLLRPERVFPSRGSCGDLLPCQNDFQHLAWCYPGSPPLFRDPKSPKTCKAWFWFPSPNLFGDLPPHQKELSTRDFLECLTFSSAWGWIKCPGPESYFLVFVKTLTICPLKNYQELFLWRTWGHPRSQSPYCT